MSHPECWLRGPVEGVPPLLQPVAHALLQVVEDVEAASAGLGDGLWSTPGGAASVAFHLAHLSGSTDRLFTYARGGRLNDVQRQALAAEATVNETRPPATVLLDQLRATVASALEQLRRTNDATLGESRSVGRAALPSTVAGLLFHAAEHASRHAGQLVTTAKIVRDAERAKD